ncbi:hypothetical protein CMO83_00195 [Candidatus Woesearchaeota archaeon]|jgi:hypothetical protein|nr:hypothetical protein [Candidatus Woesearchaeota archaeon]|tara:strand:- start:9555 stop:10625 length:1071 start_codon:yes stop_codon:yes gene_type:complete
MKKNEMYIRDKKEKNLIYDKSGLTSNFTSILRFGIAVALFIFFAAIVNAADVVIEAGKIGSDGDNLELQTAGTTRITILDSDGKVGIATSAPSSELDVSGQLRINSAINDKIILAGSQSGPHTVYLDNSKGIRFWDNLNSELVRITNTGDVGIGTASPAVELDVSSASPEIRLTDSDQGSSNEFGKLRLDAGLFEILIDDTGGTDIAIQSDGDIILAPDTGGNVGIGTTSPAEKLDVNGNVLAVAYFYSSDERLKTNIKPLDGLKIISGLNGFSFDWRENGIHDLGLVAQDVERTLPELVSTNSDGMKSVKYGSLIAPLIESVKQLMEQNMRQNIRIGELELQLSQLRDEVNGLKK